MKEDTAEMIKALNIPQMILISHWGTLLMLPASQASRKSGRCFFT